MGWVQVVEVVCASCDERWALECLDTPGGEVYQMHDWHRWSFGKCRPFKLSLVTVERDGAERRRLDKALDDLLIPEVKSEDVHKFAQANCNSLDDDGCCCTNSCSRCELRKRSRL